MVNPMELLKFKDRLDRFNASHPKVAPFFRAVGEKALVEGTVMEIKFTTPDGEELVSNIKINADDVETIRQLTELGRQG